MASISLQKGQTLSLSKGDNGLKNVFMGLGWEPAKPSAPQKKGFLSSLIGGGGGGRQRAIDLDASVIVFDASKNIIDIVSYKKLHSNDRAIIHDGDNLTGDGDGDDEVINVNLEQLNPAAAHLVFTVNSFSGQNFKDVEDAEARLVDKSNGNEICKFVLAEKGAHTCVIMASLAKGADGWEMTAHGIPGTGRTVEDMANQAKSVI